MDNEANVTVSPSENVLLQEYREAMESQRTNTNIVYSWTASIFLILSGGLFFFGVSNNDIIKFIPSMILAIILALIWLGLTETFIFYMKQRFRRIHEIEQILGMKLMAEAGKEIKLLGWKAKFVEARTYIRLFILCYIAVWILMFILRLRSWI